MTEWIKGNKVLFGYCWMKEIKNGLLISLAQRHGGRTGVDHAGIGNISLSTKPFVSQKPDYHSPKPEWISASRRSRLGGGRGWWDVNVSSVSLGNSLSLQGWRSLQPAAAAAPFSLSEVEPPIGYSTCALNLALQISLASPCLCFDFLSAPCNLFCSEWETGMSARVSARLINNDRIYHFAVCEVTLLVTRWGNLFHSNHE